MRLTRLLLLVLSVVLNMLKMTNSGHMNSRQFSAELGVRDSVLGRSWEYLISGFIKNPNQNALNFQATLKNCNQCDWYYQGRDSDIGLLSCNNGDYWKWDNKEEDAKDPAATDIVRFQCTEGWTGLQGADEDFRVWGPGLAWSWSDTLTDRHGCGPRLIITVTLPRKKTWKLGLFPIRGGFTVWGMKLNFRAHLLYEPWGSWQLMGEAECSRWREEAR